jgi:hypothetical protein
LLAELEYRTGGVEGDVPSGTGDDGIFALETASGSCHVAVAVLYVRILRIGELL